MEAPQPIAARRRRRTPKAPLPLWIVENREAQPSEDGKGWTSGELAARLGVADSTVRGWETGRSVSEDNIRAMERLFGTQAPGHDEPSSGDPQLVAALLEQAAAIRDLVEELRLSRAGQVEATEIAFQALGALGAAQGRTGTPDGSAHEADAGTHR